MQPTMKMRWRKANLDDQCIAFGVKMGSALWGSGERVLQQLWVTVLSDGEVIHEWRDIEIAEE